MDSSSTSCIANRDVVVLRYMEDLTYEEIARHLGVPVSTIETRLHRAKKQLSPNQF